MLHALTEASESILGWDAAAGGQYFCPTCHDSLVFKPGRTVVPHFAHFPGAACVYGEGESARHLVESLNPADAVTDNVCLLVTYVSRLRLTPRQDVTWCLRVEECGGGGAWRQRTPTVGSRQR